MGMARPPITTITPEAARLRLAQVLSPAFPVGGFAWSQGLEWAMDAGMATRETLPGWLSDWLDHGAGWTDAVLAALALRPGADHAALDDLARAACPSSQRLAETAEQGAAFAANIAALTGRVQPAAALPVAFGRACAPLPLPHAEILAAFLQAQAAALISAAVRFLPLGPLEGQRMLAGLQPAILQAADRAAGADELDLASAAWGADIAAMRHETMTTRIFRS
ncbi:urease accessory protein UreF [Paracoccus siganidrum]|uniref:Urease accessory protein UreF n=1 Tax=Paracoccus siganidrum TaxID=1276757 RepID=A0A419A0U9_9RHOB|nr:urease accessory UreF family protein [Paracoccus siganidrum]RJL06498.1 urease accessory protein UreF [Paracoccus siganidrum]RMC41145.1 urease accessory protein UreF [Paracoccus siganidrum]